MYLDFPSKRESQVCGPLVEDGRARATVLRRSDVDASAVALSHPDVAVRQASHEAQGKRHRHHPGDPKFGFAEADRQEMHP